MKRFSQMSLFKKFKKLNFRLIFLLRFYILKFSSLNIYSGPNSKGGRQSFKVNMKIQNVLFTKRGKREEEKGATFTRFWFVSTFSRVFPTPGRREQLIWKMKSFNTSREVNRCGEISRGETKMASRFHKNIARQKKNYYQFIFFPTRF